MLTKAMYLELFNAVTDAIEVLQKAQIKTEEMYVELIEEKEPQ